MKYDYVLDSYAWAESFDGTEKGKKVKGITRNKGYSLKAIPPPKARAAK